MAAGSCHSGGPFQLCTGSAGGGLGRTEGERFPSSVAGSQLDHAFPPEVLFLMLAAQEVGHLHHQRQRHDPDAQGVHHLRRHV